MISGCALLVDYVLTIAVSIASGADAVFSSLPLSWQPYKLVLAVVGVGVLTLMNLRDIRETVMPLVPVFLIFVGTHALAIIWALFSHGANLPDVVAQTAGEFRASREQLGLLGMLLLVLRSYSMGAGTYTGIEAVSNGLPMLREPRVRTGKRTMRYMATSLALTAMGLMIAYVFYGLRFEEGKTMNAVLFEGITANWPADLGYGFILVTLASEAAILFVAAQAGFMDGPRVIATMAHDKWFPTRFGTLSDRLVTQNGILLMGAAALVVMLATRGRIGMLIILYSINVFITFILSQLGMVRHWWLVRRTEKRWRRRISVNGLGLATCVFILISIVAVKFYQGGWVTLVITGSLVAVAVSVKRHYAKATKLLSRLDGLVAGAESMMLLKTEAVAASGRVIPAQPTFDPKAKTAVLLVNGFNGLGIHSFYTIARLFGGTFKNFAFVQVGMVDAGNFKGAQEVDHLNEHVKEQVDRYARFASLNGCYAEGFYSVGVDVVDEMSKLTPKILERFPGAVFFGGQMVFPEENVWSRWLHNYVVFAVPRSPSSRQRAATWW